MVGFWVGWFWGLGGGVEVVSCEQAKRASWLH